MLLEHLFNWKGCEHLLRRTNLCIFFLDLFKIILLKIKHLPRFQNGTWFRYLQTLRKNAFQCPVFITSFPHVLSTCWCIFVSISMNKIAHLYIICSFVQNDLMWNSSAKCIIENVYYYASKLDQILDFSLLPTWKWTFWNLTGTDTKNMRQFMRQFMEIFMEGFFFNVLNHDIKRNAVW